MYTIYHIFLLLPIKDLIKEEREPTMSFNLASGTKPFVSQLRLLFCPFIVRKGTAHVTTKALNICHQGQKGFRGIFVGITQHQKWYLMYVPCTRKIISSYDVVFYESFSCALAYTSQTYA